MLPTANDQSEIRRERERELYEALSTNKKLEQKNPKQISLNSPNKLCNAFSRVEKWVGKMHSWAHVRSVR